VRTPLDLLSLSANELVALIIATSFAAGLNVYATIATLGLLSHAGIIALPPALGLLHSWWVIGASAVLFVVEFVADKVPAFDLVWNMLQTFVRVPAGALLAFGASAPLSPGWQLSAAALGGLVAFLAHGGKTAVRAAVTASPEPFSNAALSLGEDAFAIFITWFASRHPFAAAAIVLGCIAVILLLARWVWRALGGLFRTAGRRLTPGAGRQGR
jgi:hypothetical protein